MKNKSVLSIAPYYGGKGRMAHFISDRLNYDDTDIYVEPFGGLARVLLNKRRHSVECYNDLNPGLCSLMRILSKPDSASELIHRLYDETEYSQDEFNKQRVIYDACTVDVEQQEREKLRRMLINQNLATAVTANRILTELEQVAQGVFPEDKSTKAVKCAYKNLYPLLDSGSPDNPIKQQIDIWSKLYLQKREQGFIECEASTSISDMDLAIATFVVFQMSRDGMGKSFSSAKFKSTDQYLKQVLNLYDCAEQLEGLRVFQINALSFFRDWCFIEDNPSVTLPDSISKNLFNQWINNERVMMYLDPSYLNPQRKNLGKVYAHSFEYDEHEYFLKCIQNAKAKILVSNYDLEIYNKYLNEDTGWRREEYFTTTGVGGKVDNQRTEVIWYNY